MAKQRIGGAHRTYGEHHELQMKGWMVDYISERMPEFEAVARRSEWADVFDNLPYFPVQALYQFAVAEFAAGRHDVVVRALDVVEEALSSGIRQIVDPFSINFIERLAGEKRRNHFDFFVSHLGPESQKDLATKG